jgi:hypothetical protein
VRGIEDRDRVWFGEPCEEEEVRVLSEGVLNVVVSRLQLPGGDDRDGVTELIHERRAPRSKSSLFHADRLPSAAIPGSQNGYPPQARQLIRDRCTKKSKRGTMAVLALWRLNVSHMAWVTVTRGEL